MKDLLFEFSKVTEEAAIASYKHLGYGDENLANDAAVQAMRYVLNLMKINGKVVIGEGEIDEASMLYFLKKLGAGGPNLDIAIDPIDGVRMVAYGQMNTMSVIAATKEGSLISVPNMYMEKLVVGPKAKGEIDINKPLVENLVNVAAALEKPLNKLVVKILDRDRHRTAIDIMSNLGVKVYLFNDGDISSSILTCMPFSDVDVYYGIGGAPEGMITAIAVKALGGDMQSKFVLQTTANGDSSLNKIIANEEVKKCAKLGIDVERKYTLDEMVKTDDIVFSATGITKGDLVEGIENLGNNILKSETLLIKGNTQTFKKVQSTHVLERKDKFIKRLVL